MATPIAQVNEWHAFLRARPYLNQFGQSDDESTFNGATGCTHTDLQTLIEAKTGRRYSHDEISRVAGYPWPSNNPNRRGLRWSMSPDSEVMRVVRAFGLPYTPYFVDGALTSTVERRFWAALSRGPVMGAIRYSHWPDKRGYVYNGTKADGYPNGFAITGGRTQLSGAESIAHAVIFVDYYRSSSLGRYVVDAKEPNHGSPARPERPAYDRITTDQARAAIRSIRLLTVGGEPRSLAFLLPTGIFVPR